MKRTAGFGRRVFTPAEIEYCDSKGVTGPQSYAARFAAKEAFLKALSTGWRGRISWQEIEVVVDANGAPSMNVTGEAARIMSERGAGRVHLSLSHTSAHAIAHVILES